MDEDRAARIEEGIELLSDQLTKVEGMAGVFLPALKGFRRDLSLAAQENPKYFFADFRNTASIIGVPPLRDGSSFSDLHKMLSLAEDAIDGVIRIKNPPLGPSTLIREKVLSEMDMVHRNLADVADTSHRLYEAIQAASFEFDVFNSKNIDGDFIEGNILFDRDALNLSMVTARAIAERAVRLDIDLMQSRHALETGIEVRK
jgi:hypothetical protein